MSATAPPATREHVAIVHAWVARALIEGHKTVESRFSRDRRAPFGRIGVGDTVYFRVAGGTYAARALVERVLCEDGLTPRRVRAIEVLHRASIGGDDEYWRMVRGARCVTLLWLTGCCGVESGPFLERARGDRRAWFVLG